MPKECLGEVHITADVKFNVTVRDYMGILKPAHSLCTKGNPSHVYVNNESGDISVALD